MINEQDKALHAANIKTTQFSIPTGYGYNNYDIRYTGDTVYIPFTITLDAAVDKKYKPNFPVTTAKIATIGTVTVDDDVKYIMLQTTDPQTITTKAEFDKIYDELDTKYKGTMHKTEANLYNMYDITNPNLNGVLDNCKLWVMATGTNTTDSTPVVAFDTHTFTNIYTPINVYWQGETTTGYALYAKTRVGVDGNLEAVYGLPLELNGDLILKPDKDYDTIDDIMHIDLEQFWTFIPSIQNDVTNVILNSKDFMDKVFKFEYDKNPVGWFSAKFKFEDFNGVSLDHDGDGNLDEEVDVADFVPDDDDVSNSYMLGMDLYQAPTITNYDPIGYKIGTSGLVEKSFPLKYGEI